MLLLYSIKACLQQCCERSNDSVAVDTIICFLTTLNKYANTTINNDSRVNNNHSVVPAIDILYSYNNNKIPSELEKIQFIIKILKSYNNSTNSSLLLQFLYLMVIDDFQNIFEMIVDSIINIYSLIPKDVSHHCYINSFNNNNKINSTDNILIQTTLLQFISQLQLILTILVSSITIDNMELIATKLSNSNKMDNVNNMFSIKSFFLKINNFVFNNKILLPMMSIAIRTAISFVCVFQR